VGHLERFLNRLQNSEQLMVWYSCRQLSCC
jgi:hypothetical protein